MIYPEQHVIDLLSFIRSNFQCHQVVMITKENLSMCRFQLQEVNKRGVIEQVIIKIETILLAVLMEPESLFRLHFQESVVDSSQLRVRSRGVQCNSSAVGNSEEEYITGRCCRG